MWNRAVLESDYKTLAELLISRACEITLTPTLFISDCIFLPPFPPPSAQSGYFYFFKQHFFKIVVQLLDLLFWIHFPQQQVSRMRGRLAANVRAY